LHASNNLSFNFNPLIPQQQLRPQAIVQQPLNSYQYNSVDFQPNANAFNPMAYYPMNYYPTLPQQFIEFTPKPRSLPYSIPPLVTNPYVTSFDSSTYSKIPELGEEIESEFLKHITELKPFGLERNESEMFYQRITPAIQTLFDVSKIMVDGNEKLEIPSSRLPTSTSEQLKVKPKLMVNRSTSTLNK